MVSLWPWRGDSSSTSSFEKTLSALSTKIKTTQTRLEALRVSSRRIKLLCTLYLSFAYLVYAIVALAVVGYQEFGMYEWTGLAGAPLFIYGLRTALTAYYTFRIDALSTRLKAQQAEREKTIQKLKDATKYDSTMELIEKYGGTEGKSAKGKGKNGEEEQQQQQSTTNNKGRKTSGGRTSFVPPPTANIPGRNFSGQNPPPQQQRQVSSGAPPPPQPRDPLEPTAEFAPNADSPTSPPPYDSAIYSASASAAAASGPAMATGRHWYDRIFDTLLGEDETAAVNRIVLLCGNPSCRLVNGQAPPGTKSLAEIGKWRCMSCGALNGEDKVAPADEGKSIVRQVLEEAAAAGKDVRKTMQSMNEGEEEEASLKEEDVHDDDEATSEPEMVEIVGKNRTSGGNDDDEDNDGGGPAASVRKRRSKRS